MLSRLSLLLNPDADVVCELSDAVCPETQSSLTSATCKCEAVPTEKHAFADSRADAASEKGY